MKVLMLVSWYSPKDAPVISAGVFHYEQALALKPFCETALYFPYDTQLSNSFSRKTEHGLLTYRTKPSAQSNRFSRQIGKLHFLFQLHRVCKDFKPDIIHAHCGLPAGRLALSYQKLFGIPVIITEHCPIEYMNLNDPNMKEAYSKVYKESITNICVSQSLKNQLQDVFSDCKFDLIYNGVADPSLQVQSSPRYAKEGGLNCGIAAGFYSLDVKGYQFLLPAIRKLKDLNVNVFLHICGAGKYLPHYQDLAKKLEITDNCIFYGQCDKTQVYSILAQMDFCISASLFESAGVFVEEAMLLGKPLVVTRSGGASSLVNDQAAIVVDCGSTEALVQGILAMEKTLTCFSSEKIRSYATEKFLIEQVSAQYYAHYQNLISR